MHFNILLMFSLSNISVQFTGEYIFREVSFLINKRDRIGLVGKNGTGKSTLCKVMKGILKPESGEVSIPNHASIGYLPQELKIESKRTVFEEALLAFDKILKWKEELRNLSGKISNSNNYESDAYMELIRKYNELNEKIDIAGGQNIEADTEKVLSGLGFKRNDYKRNISEFSYGWQMRIEIAKILLQKPDLVMLDEPTNHLDIESIQWLEEFLDNYPGAVVIVSHDRALLDNITKRTIEISQGKIFDYKSSYSDYLKMREERLEKQIAAFNNQQNQVRQIERFIERFRYKNTKAKQVQSKIKMLEKMDKVEIEEIDQSSINFSFPGAPSSGKIVIEAEGINKSYGNGNILENVDFVAMRGERIAFVGRNGEGKTTFSKIISGNLSHEGNLKIGHHVLIGYYAQNQGEMLDPSKTVFQTIDDIATGDVRARIRGILGGFLFSDEDIDKKVSVLSGGEKARLSLAKLLLSPVNLLILDEPTNHLDMPSKDILKNALLQFKGTMIIVSHDRDFLQGLTNKVYEFRNKGVKEYIGDVYDFIRSRRMKNLSELNQAMKKKKDVVSTQKSQGKVKWEKRKEYEREKRRLEKQILMSEDCVEKLENQITEMDKLLSNPNKNKELMNSGEVFTEYNTLKKSLDLEMEKWETLQNKLEELDGNFK